MSHKCYKCGEGLDKGQIAKAKELEKEFDAFSPDFYICYECDMEHQNNEPDYEQFSDCDPGL